MSHVNLYVTARKTRLLPPAMGTMNLPPEMLGSLHSQRWAPRPTQVPDPLPLPPRPGLNKEHAAMSDPVNHPPHYMTEAGIEAIDVMERYDLGLHLGNAMKYLLRAGRKGDAMQDLRKARWYVQRWLERPAEYRVIPIAAGVADMWKAPDEIVQAFGLEGGRRVVVLSLLSAAAATTNRGTIEEVEHALWSLDMLIKDGR